MFHFRHTERGCVGYSVGSDGVITILRPHEPGGGPIVQSRPVSPQPGETKYPPIVGVTDGPLIYPED
jgi:hypothetical protein